MFSKIQMITKFGEIAEQKSAHAMWEYEGNTTFFLLLKGFVNPNNSLPMSNGRVGYWDDQKDPIGYLCIVEPHKGVEIDEAFRDCDSGDRELQFFLDVAPISLSYTEKRDMDDFLTGLFLMKKEALVAWWEWADNYADDCYPSPMECLKWMQGIVR